MSEQDGQVVGCEGKQSAKPAETSNVALTAVPSSQNVFERAAQMVRKTFIQAAL
jgi:hypothetical protein